MGTFAQRQLAASSLRHCGSPAPITRDAAISCPLFTLDKILGCLWMFLPRALVRRSPGYLPAVVQLDAVLDPGGLALCSSVSHSPRGLRHIGKDRHALKLNLFSGLCVRFRATPFTSLLSFIFLSGLRLQSLNYWAADSPYPGGLGCSSPFPLSKQPLPGCPNSNTRNE